MGQYHGFAGIYDMFMANTDYDGWVSYTESIFEMFGKKPGLILELGCGTGNASIRFKERGYDVIGLDNSPDMLSAAKQKNSEILFINQDMREFELYGTVDAVISLCDSLNYIPDKKGLSSVFRHVRNYLNPGGLFVFDMNTIYKYEHILAQNTFSRVMRDAAFIWENSYYSEQRINEYNLTFFVKREDGFYDRFRERHIQRAYAASVVATLIEDAGLSVLGLYRAKTFRKPSASSRRIFFAARKD